MLFFANAHNHHLCFRAVKLSLLSDRDLGAELLLQHSGGRVLPNHRSLPSSTAGTALQAHSQDYHMHPLFVARRLRHGGHSVHLRGRSYASAANVSFDEWHGFWKWNVAWNERNVSRSERNTVWR